jgi:hypothetical protein
MASWLDGDDGGLVMTEKSRSRCCQVQSTTIAAGVESVDVRRRLTPAVRAVKRRGVGKRRARHHCGAAVARRRGRC